jgi:hypothetical protein
MIMVKINNPYLRVGCHTHRWGRRQGHFFFLYLAPRIGWGGSSTMVGADGGCISGGSSGDRLCLMRAWLSVTSRSASSELVQRARLSAVAPKSTEFEQVAALGVGPYEAVQGVLLATWPCASSSCNSRLSLFFRPYAPRSHPSSNHWWTEHAGLSARSWPRPHHASPWSDSRFH